MTSPTPSPAVPEALRLAEEAKQSLSEALNSAEAIGYPLAGAMSIRRAKEDRDDARAAIDRLAALVQPPDAPAAETALRMAVERHMTCRFYFGSTVAQATVPGGPAVYETVENHADPLAGACQAIAQAAAKIDAGTPAPQVPLEAARLVGGEAANWTKLLDALAPTRAVYGREGVAFDAGFRNAIEAVRGLASGQAAPTDAPGEQK